MRFATIFATASAFLSVASALTIPHQQGRGVRAEYDSAPQAVPRKALSRRAAVIELADLIERMLLDDDNELMARVTPPPSPKLSPKGSAKTSPPPSRPGSPTPAGNPGLQALSVVGPALQKLGIQYAVLGGAAAAALGSTRATTDIDLVMVPKGNVYAYELSETLKKLPGWTTVKEHGQDTPAVVLGQTTVPVEIFDAPTWVSRPQYGLVGKESTTVKLADGTPVSVFNAQWQLREKIATAHQRGKVGTAKASTDIADVRFLASIIPAAQYQKGLLVFGPGEYKDALAGLLKRPDVPKDLAANLVKIIKA